MTVRLVARGLRSRPARALLAAAGVATCTTLVLVLAGTFHGVQDSMERYAGRRDVDLWVGPPGADNLIRGSFASLIPLTVADSIRLVDGVAEAQPILKAFLSVRAVPRSRGRAVTLLAVGYVVPDGLGGPPEMAAGETPSGRHRIVLDRAAAFRLGVGIGDTVELSGRRVMVVGLTRGTNILATQFMFTDLAAAGAAAGATGQASFVLVRLESGETPAAAAVAIRGRFPELQVYSRDEFLAANRREVTAGFVPIIVLVGTLGAVAAAVLVGLLVHAAAEERRSDIAILLALGADLRVVSLGLVRQAAVLVAAGVLVGTLVAAGMALVLDRFVPTIPLNLTLSDVVVTAMFFFGIGLAAAIVPAARLGRVDPMEAFRS